MSKKFKPKRRLKLKIRYLVYVLIMIIVYQLTYNLLLKNNLAHSNEEFLKKLLQDSNHHLLYEQVDDNFINKFSTMLTNFNLSEPLSILETSFGYKTESNSKLVYNDTYEPEKLEQVTEYIKDPNPKQIENPIVYIYNTHQLENYSNKNLEAYNISPNVMMASYLLKENLNELGIPTLVEESNITEFLRMNNWDYSQSYKASRFYVLDAINKYSSIKLFIDFHRDAISKDASTVTINDKSYAKVLLVVGTDYENYNYNLSLANSINEIINEKYPNLSRGIIKKGGAGVDGIYNQDLFNGMLLIECGGTENSIEEVINTVDALSVVIKEYLG